MSSTLSRLFRTSARPATTRLRLQALEDRTVPTVVPTVIYAVGAGESGARVRVFNNDGSLRFDFFAYETSFRGGVHVATADVTRDGQADIITAPGNGGGPLIKVFDGNTGDLVRAFIAYDANFRGGAWVAGGDMNGDGQAEIATGAGDGGGPHVKIYNGATNALEREFMAYDPNFRGGVRVATARLRFGQPVGLITGAGVGGGSMVNAYDGLSGGLRWSRLVGDPTGRNGTFITGGDVTGDGIDEVFVGAGGPSSSRVQILGGIDGRPIASMPNGFETFADGPNDFGVRVRAVDLDGDGRADLIASEGAGGAPEVRTFSGVDFAPMATASAFEAEFLGGLYVG